MKIMSKNKIGEQNVSVILSEVLEQIGITNISLLNFGKIPDIYLLLRGVRIIIEIKEEGHYKDLVLQLQQRLDMNLCDIAVGLEYPLKVVTNTFSAPSTKDVRKYLLTGDLRAVGFSLSASDYKILFKDHFIRTNELPELLISVTSEAMPQAELEEAIEKVRSVVIDFAKEISNLPNAESISEKIREELELGT